MMSVLPATVQRALVDIVGARQVVLDPDARAPYERDWTGRFTGSTPAVVRPGSVEEVAACVAVCADAGVAVSASRPEPRITKAAVRTTATRATLPTRTKPPP